MTEQSDNKTNLEKSRVIISQLKEMEHYSKTNIEKLTKFWLQVDDELKQKKMAKILEELISQQNAFHDSLASAVSDYESECKRIEKEAS
jgi:DNA-binding transcriptional regulator YbjK